MTIGVPIVTCLHRVRRIRKVRVGVRVRVRVRRPRPCTPNTQSRRAERGATTSDRDTATSNLPKFSLMEMPVHNAIHIAPDLDQRELKTRHPAQRLAFEWSEVGTMYPHTGGQSLGPRIGLLSLNNNKYNYLLYRKTAHSLSKVV